jgi:pseudo-response regulator 5
VDVENKNGDSAAPSQDITETNRPAIRVVPFPVPVQGLTFDGQPFWNGTPMASLFYPQSAPPIASKEAKILSLSWNSFPLSKKSHCQ